MENSATTSGTLSVYDKLHKKHGNIGIVLQAYLFRTFEDLKERQNDDLNF